MLSCPGQMHLSQPENASHAPAQVSQLVLAGTEEPLFSGESSVPTATSCKESCEKVLPFPPERTTTMGNPQKLWEGTAKGLPKALREGCKGTRAKSGEMDGSRWDALRGSSGATVRKAGVWQGKESNVKIPERNPPSIWYPDPPPQLPLSDEADPVVPQNPPVCCQPPPD